MPRKRPQFKDFLDSEPNQNSLLSIALDEIILPKSQVRQYFDPKKLEQLAESIEQHGVIEPLLITSQNELIAGERRLRASRIAGLTQLPVKVLDVSSSEAKTLAIVENLQREDLNPVEETEGILELLQLKLERERDEIISLLYKMNKKDDNVIISDCEAVKNTFKSLGKLKWESFVINRLRLLNLPELILSAIKQGKIEYTKGITIARIKDSEFRDKLLDETIADNLSLKDIRERIAQCKNQISTNYSNLSTDELIQDLRQSYQKLSRSQKIWSDKKNRKKLEVLLKQLKSLIEE
ncbi:MAG: ParB/RepB/Spo0J family partition protein [Pleurocapsa sp. SU_5_0]|nr:ParB/RepB/Spo0J family partition protein [Pleurocapsa sp. SU_5_0]NJO98218.1 ParB/RepB/Spo0J family partition protein [Pleurocapsa sp. CRU_1_2]